MKEYIEKKKIILMLFLGFIKLKLSLSFNNYVLQIKAKTILTKHSWINILNFVIYHFFLYFLLRSKLKSVNYISLYLTYHFYIILYS